MAPVIALVGRPNVGKSTLFNRLTRSRDALVASYAGLTRDRQYGQGVLGDFDYMVVDTGGLSGNEVGIDGSMAEQSLAASYINQMPRAAENVLVRIESRHCLGVSARPCH